MGIELWLSRTAPPAEPVAAPSPASEPIALAKAPAPMPVMPPASVAPAVVAEAPAGGRTDPAAEMDWQTLAATVADCRQCPLHAKRRQAVFGVGHRQADWLFVGEAPGAEEDRRGEPFVGRAGRLLDEMLFALGVERQDVYIANVLKCRPPANRDPMGEEVRACEGYLHRQVRLIAPRVIVALGRFAAQSLLRSSRPINALRGRTHCYGDTGVPLVVTYHPAYLLRSAIDKRKAWADLCLAREALVQ